MDYEQTGYKLPLPKKADIIDRNIQQRHNLLGLYPSMVEVPLDGSLPDHSTSSVSDVNHAVCWTAYHLSGMSHYVAYLSSIGDTERLYEARARTDELFEGVYRCLLIAGGNGLQARGYRTGHGPVHPEETDAASRTRNHWFQGTGEYRDLRWREDPSHHNYSHSSFAYGTYWRLAAQGMRKKQCAHPLSISVGYWADRNFTLYRRDNDGQGYPMFNLSDGKTLTTSVLMVLGALKVAACATEQTRFADMYTQIAERFMVKTCETLVLYRDFDDASQTFIHLENLLALETDPALVKGYQTVMQKLWDIHRKDGQSLYNFIYAAHTPSASDRARIVKDGLKALFSWPTDMTIRPRMNSLDKDIKPPYPVYRAVFDNEYIWKGNLLKPDGWLSRTVTQVETSKEDPYVLYALEENGDLYYSYDRAKMPASWKHAKHALERKLIKIVQGKRTRIMLGMTEDGFYRSQSALSQWEPLPVPQDGGKPFDLIYDTNTDAVYAITDRNVYRSVACDEEFIGQNFECLTERLPKGHTYRFAIGLQGNGRIYALCPTVKKYHPTPTLYWETACLLTSALDEDDWQAYASFDFAYGLTRAYDWIYVDPFDSDHLIMGVHEMNVKRAVDLKLADDGRDEGPISMLSHSYDCGRTWSPDMHAFYEAFWQSGASALAKCTIPSKINGCPIADLHDPGVVYAACDHGLLVSHDAGHTYTIKNDGLEIKRIRALSYDPVNRRLYAGTPAGLFISKDGGQTFFDGNLCLQFDRNTRREIGGAAFLDAYRRAMYYGLINEAGDVCIDREGTPHDQSI